MRNEIDNNENSEGGINEETIETASGQDSEVMINNLKDLSQRLGMEYDFLMMTPTIEETGENVRIYFTYNSLQNSGGTPIATINKTSGEFVEISFTQ